MSNRKWDWSAIEREYVAGDMGLRELARAHGMANHSMVMEQSRRNDWAGKREAYRARAATKALTLMADDEGRRIAREREVREHAIDAIDDAILKMRADMGRMTKRMKDGVWVEEPLVVVRPSDVAMLIDRLQVLFGKPSQISEERSLGINLSAATEPDVLRALVDATRGFVADAGDMGGSPLPRIERPRSN